jgi:hypothetical protein
LVEKTEGACSSNESQSPRGSSKGNDAVVVGLRFEVILFYVAGVGVSGYYLKKTLAQDTENKWTMKSLFWELYMGNIVFLRDRIQPVIGNIPFIWCVLMKHVIPHLLIILFINLAQSDNGEGDAIFGGYGGYATSPFQILGILTWVFALFIFLAGVGFPKLYEPLALPQIKEGEEEMSKYMTPKDIHEAGEKGENGSSEENEEVGALKKEGEAEAVAAGDDGSSVEIEA